MKKSKNSSHAPALGVTKRRLKLFESVFVARRDAFALVTGDRILARRESLTRSVLADHLAGKCRVGSYLIMPDGRTPYLVIDIDVSKRKLVRRLLKRLKKRGVTAHVERSKSKGFHIWVFFSKPVCAILARRFAQGLLRGIEETKIEIFPKQDSVSGSGLGNCIWLPYFGLDVGGGRTVFLNDEFEPITKRWSFLHGLDRVPRKRIVALARKVEPKRLDRSLRVGTFKTDASSSLNTCAQTILLKGAEDGHRNTALFTLAKHLRNVGLTQSRVEDLVLEANNCCSPPFKERKATNIAKSVFKHGYKSMGCDDPYIASLCGERCPVKRSKNRHSSTSAEELMARVDVKPSIHPAQSFHKGVLWYGQKLGKECLWVNSNRQAYTFSGMRRKFTLAKRPMKSCWSLPSIKTFVRKQKKLRPDVLFTDLRNFISERIRFVAPWQVTVVTLWVMGSYVYRVFDWYGYLWLTSPGRRAGKTRLLEIISALAFNATPVMTDPTEASLFRETANNASTQVLDEIESMRGSDQEKRAALMSLLNAGFKAGSTVPRFNNNKDKIEYHDAFCPRILAGINRLAPTLADRCFKIFLRRKLPSETIERFSERRFAKYLQKKRNLLHRFGLLYAGPIAKQYSKADSLPIPKEADDRARDIMEPLFAIASVLDQQNPSLKITDQLIQAGQKIARDREADQGEDEETTATLEILSHEFPKWSRQWNLASSKAQAIFTKHDALEWVESRKQAARLLRQLGFKSAAHRKMGKVFRAYGIPRHRLEDLCARYGVAPPRKRLPKRYSGYDSTK